MTTAVVAGMQITDAGLEAVFKTVDKNANNRIFRDSSLVCLPVVLAGNSYFVCSVTSLLYLVANAKPELMW